MTAGVTSRKHSRDEADISQFSPADGPTAKKLKTQHEVSNIAIESLADSNANQNMASSSSNQLNAAPIFEAVPMSESSEINTCKVAEYCKQASKILSSSSSLTSGLGKQAINKYQEALKLCGKGTLERAKILEECGKVYRQRFISTYDSDFQEKAVDYLDQAADIFLDLKQHQSAISPLCLLLEVAKNPSYELTEAYAKLSEAYNEQGDLDKEIQALKQALHGSSMHESMKKKAELCKYLGDAYKKKENWELCVRYYNKALNILAEVKDLDMDDKFMLDLYRSFASAQERPERLDDNSTVRMHRDRLRKAAQCHAATLEHLDKNLPTHLDSTLAARTKCALLFYEVGDLNEARTHFEALILHAKTHPLDADLLCKFCRHFAETRENEKAIELLKHAALFCSSADQKIWQGLWRSALIARGQDPEPIVSSVPENTSQELIVTAIYHTIAGYYLDAGQLENAKCWAGNVSKRLKEVKQEIPSLLYLEMMLENRINGGRILEQSNDLNTALVSYKETVRVLENIVEGKELSQNNRNRLAFLYFRIACLGAQESREKFHKKALEFVQNKDVKIKILRELAQILNGQKRLPETLDVYIALHNEGEQVGAACHALAKEIGNKYQNEQHHEEAEKFFITAARYAQEPEEQASLFFTSSKLAEKRDPQQACKYLEEGLKKTPISDPLKAKLHYFLAWHTYQIHSGQITINHLRKIIEHLEAANKCAPGHKEILIVLITVYGKGFSLGFANEHVQKALECLNTCMSLAFPNHEKRAYCLSFAQEATLLRPSKEMGMFADAAYKFALQFSSTSYEQAETHYRKAMHCTDAESRFEELENATSLLDGATDQASVEFIKHLAREKDRLLGGSGIV